MNLSERVITTIEKNLEQKTTVLAGNRLVDDLGVDSFGKIILLNALEDEFNTTFKEEDIDNLVTVSDIITKLQAYGF